MSLDHLFAGLGSSLFLNAGVDHDTVLVDSDNGQAQDLLGDSQTASLGGVHCTELDGGVLGLKAMDVGHQSSAGNAAVAVVVNQDLAGCFQNFCSEVVLSQFEQSNNLL